MKVAALFSGGKDSTYAVRLAQMWGWDITSLVTIRPAATDSHMFHVPNLHVTPLLAEALGLPLTTVDTHGREEEEVEAMKEALEPLDIDGVVSGAVASEYQRTRIERVCHELGIKSFTPLWHKAGETLVADMIHAGMDIRIVGCFAEGLDERWLGRRLDIVALGEIKALNARRRIHVSGEGGEYESLVVDAPWFSKRVDIVSSRNEWRRDSGTHVVEDARLVAKG